MTPTRKVRGYLALCALLSTTATGCGSSDTPSAAATQTVTETVTSVVTETVTEVVTAKPTRPEEKVEDKSSTPSNSDEPSPAPTVPADIELSLDEFFQPSEYWEEDRYDVAGQDDVRGIATTVWGCTRRDSTSLELRLANKFKILKFSVGQADTSDSSEQVITVEVVGNGTQLEIRQVPFNQIQSFEIDVAGVNALKMYFYDDEEKSSSCSSDTTSQVVLQSVVVTN